MHRTRRGGRPLPPRIAAVRAGSGTPPLLRRWQRADDIARFPAWRIGLSCAASWSWGVSLAVGVSIMHTRGVIPFAAWMGGNILALPLFGVLLTLLPEMRRWIGLAPMLLLFWFVEYFAITLNLEALRGALGGGGDFVTYPFLGERAATAAVLGCGLLIICGIQKFGVRGSVLNDQVQFAFQLAGAGGLAMMCLLAGERAALPAITSEGREWMATGFLGIVTGALGTGHQWQRFSTIPAARVLPAGLWGGTFFGMYMALVAVAGLYFVPLPGLGAVFLFIVFVLAVSTIDSAVAGMQFLAQRLGRPPWVGTAAALASLGAWVAVEPQGLTNAWTFMARVRYPVVIAAVVLTWVLRRTIRERERSPGGGG